MIYAGTIKHEADMTEALSAHRKVSVDPEKTLTCSWTVCSEGVALPSLSLHLHLSSFIPPLCSVLQIVEDEVNNGGCNITGILIGQVS